MDKTLEALHTILFREDGTNAFAILDGASIPNLLDKLYVADRPEFECLYTGEIAPDLAEAAPYLVRLERGAEFTEWVLGEGWGQHWGVFAISSGDFRALRHHLRHFLIAHDVKGKSYYFRFYDPRVLRTYLPACNPGELASFFGPVQTWVIEAEDPKIATRFDVSDGKLVSHQDPLAGA